MNLLKIYWNFYTTGTKVIAFLLLLLVVGLIHLPAQAQQAADEVLVKWSEGYNMRPGESHSGDPVSVAVDDNNVIHAVWSENTGEDPETGDRHWEIFYANNSLSTRQINGFSPPVQISSQEPGVAKKPVIAAAPNGDIYVVWQERSRRWYYTQETGNDCLGSRTTALMDEPPTEYEDAYDFWDIYYVSKPVGGDWGASAAITSAESSYNKHSTWQKTPCPDDNPPLPYDCTYLMGYTLTEVRETYEVPQISIGPDNQAQIVFMHRKWQILTYNYTRTIVTHYYSGGSYTVSDTWDSSGSATHTLEVMLSVGGGYATPVASATENVNMAPWSQGGIGLVEKPRWEPGCGTPGNFYIYPDSFPSGWPFIAVSPKDSIPHIVWEQYDVSVTSYAGPCCPYYATGAGGGYDLSEGQGGGRPHVSVDADGNPHVVWEFYDQQQGERLHYRRGSASGWQSVEDVGGPAGDRPKVFADHSENVQVLAYNYYVRREVGGSPTWIEVPPFRRGSNIVAFPSTDSPTVHSATMNRNGALYIGSSGYKGDTVMKTFEPNLGAQDAFATFSIGPNASCNVATGNVFFSLPLFACKGRGISANLSLIYNSLEWDSSDISQGWATNYHIYLTEHRWDDLFGGPRYLSLVLGDGRTIVFKGCFIFYMN